MAFKVTVGGVDKTDSVYYFPTPKITLRQNERSTASITFKIGYSPAQFSEIVIYDVDGTTARFGGIITRPVTRGNEGPSSLYNTDCQCTDFLWYCDYMYWNKTYTSDKTLKQILLDIESEMFDAGTSGIEVDSAQDDGDTFTASPETPLVFTRAKISDVLRQLATQCDPPRVVRMSPLKKVRILTPGTLIAPFSITDLAPHCQSFELAGSSFPPTDKVTLVCGPSGVGDAITYDGWACNGVTRIFALEGVAIPASSVFPGVAVVDGASVPIWDAAGVFPPNSITWDWTLNGGTLNFTGTSTPPATSLSLTYQPLFPFEVTVGTGNIQGLFTDANQINWDAAVAEANGILARQNQSPREATMRTLDCGQLLPSQAMTVTLTSRGLSAATFTITQVSMEFTEYLDPGTQFGGISGQRLWNSTVTLTETTIYQGSYIDQARQMFGGTGSGVAVATGGGSVTVLTTPFPLGGTDQARIPMAATPVEMPLLNYNDFIATSTFSGLVRCWSWVQSGTHNSRVILKNVTDSTEVMSPVIASITRSGGEQTFAVSIVAGKRYRAYALGADANIGVYAMAQLEST